MIKVMKTALALKLEQELWFAGEGIGYKSKYEGLDFTPKRATDGSSGYDIRACIESPITINPDSVFLVPTGVHVWIGDLKDSCSDNMKWSGLYMPRSSSPGLKLTNTIGLLDSDYQGESFFKYENKSQEPITINTGDKIGQLVFVLTYTGELDGVTGFDEETVRGEGGFGSTGV